ncbi:MAG TPA: hypothetical protein VF457_05580 [Burkholderiaceae bacterium]
MSLSSQPLSISARVLKPSTIEAVRRSPSFHLRGWQILDRWALDSPRELKSLEAQGIVLLLGRLLEQQELEHRTLLEALGQPQWQGMAEHEILQQQEVRTSL